MKFFQEYNRIFHCKECKYIWKLDFWQLLSDFKFTTANHFYTRCPRCGAQHWIKIDNKKENKNEYF